MSDPRILPATAKRSSSSRCTTGDGGFVGVRLQDARERRERMAQLNAPTPQEAVATMWETYERNWQERIRQSDRREREEMNERIRRDEQRLRESKEKIERLRTFRVNEQLVEGIFETYGLTPTERSRVNQRLAQIGDMHNTDAASVFAQEEVLKRGNNPADQMSGTGDWRGSIKEGKK